MKVLIVAHDAQIREALVAQFTKRDREHQCLGLEWLERRVNVNPPMATIADDIDIVINGLSIECLEYLDKKELLNDLSFLAKACKQSSIPIVHLSSSQVFDASNTGRKRERDKVGAISREGTILCELEEIVREQCLKHIILRTGPIFSSNGDNVMTRLLREFQKTEQGETLRLSNSGKSIPVSSEDLARVLSAIIDQLSCGGNAWGTYHYSSSDPASSYQFAETVLAVASQFINVNKSPLGLKPTRPSDPSWSRPQLNCSSILDTFGIKQLPWRAFVVPAVKQFFERESIAASKTGD